MVSELARKMKDSGIEWIGEIPEDWDIIKVKNVFSNSKTIVGDKAENYERLSLTLNGVLKRSKNANDGLQPEKFEGYQILFKNELVFKLIDLENIRTSRVGYSPYTGLVSPAYITLSNADQSEFGYYFFLSMWHRNIFNSLAGDGVRSNIGAKDLLMFPYPLVDKEERKKCVSYLDKKVAQINSIINQTKQSIEEYKKYKQSLITEVVTKGLDPNVKMKDSGIEWIGEIPEHWEVAFLSQIFSQVKNKNFDLEETNLLSLSYGKIIQKDIKTTDGLLPVSFNSYNIVEDGDIILRMTDLQNDHKSLRVGLCTQRGIITSAYITIRKFVDISSAFAYYFMHSFDIYKGFYGMGAGVRQGLNYNGLKRFKFAFPKIQEQLKIVNYLDHKTKAIDNIIIKKEDLISELESYKKSLIYEVVTGKKEVS